MNRSNIINAGFRKRTLPLAVDYRPMYKIGLIVLILKMVSSGSKSSLNKLHFMIWTLKSSRNISFVKQILESGDASAIVTWGVEPALNRALLYASAEGLISYYDDKYVLTDAGNNFAKEIAKDKELFIDEKLFLEFVGKRKVTESFLNNLTNRN